MQAFACEKSGDWRDFNDTDILYSNRYNAVATRKWLLTARMPKEQRWLMGAIVQVIAGPARSGKTERVLAEYRRVLAEKIPGSTLWIAPTQRSAAQVRGRLLGPELRACFQPGIVTFDSLAESVLAASSEEVRPIGDSLKRHIVRTLLAELNEAGKLEHFGPIADTRGLLDLATGFISEMKRLEIWPEHFEAACRSRGMTAKDRELVELYRRYQQALVQHRLYDREGRMWSARELLKGGQLRPFENLRLVVVDGFTDFTRTQREILAVLAARARQLLVTLPLEPAPCREDLFAKTLDTLRQLREQHPKLEEVWIPRRGRGDWPALEHIEQHIFQNPRNAVPFESDTSAKDPRGVRIEILAASRQLGEIEQIGRRIKQLLMDEKAAVGEIVVAFRTLTAAAPLVREVFREMGIPFALESTPSLDSAPVIRALGLFVRLVVEDWPFRELLAVLANNYFRPDWPEWRDGHAAVAAQQLVRELQLPSGRAELLEQVERWAAKDDADVETDDDEHRRRIVARIHKARLATPLLARFARTLDGLAEKATPTEWVDRLVKFAHAVGMRTVIDQEVEQRETHQIDKKAWETLLAILAEGDKLSSWLDETPDRIDPAGFSTLLADLGRNENVSRLENEVGRVRVLSAQSARAIDVKYLFLAGLAEKAFPLPAADDRLYADAEYRRLIAAGLPLVDHAARNQEEMLLFYEVLTRPTERLILSYPALDEAAQPLSPSSFLVEVERVCGPGVIPRTADPDLSPIPRGEAPLSPAELRVMAVAQATHDESALLAALLASETQRPMAGNLVAALRVTDQRQRGDSFGSYEGILETEAARRMLAERFGPAHLWSASRLEQYAYCPHQFFLQQVLRANPIREMALETDYFARGQLLHGTLAELHRALNAIEGAHTSPVNHEEEKFLALFGETLQRLIAQSAGGGDLEAALREIDRRTISQWAQLYHDQHKKYDESWTDLDTPLRPAHFEVRFGLGRKGADGVEDPRSTDEPFALDLGNETIRLGGRIDRIDLGVVAGQVVFSVLDYKSGLATTLNLSDIQAGTALQLPLYLLAAEAILADTGAVPWRSGYWFVRDKGYIDRRALVIYERQEDRLEPTADWLALRRTIVARIRELIDGMRRGEFPMQSADEECTGRCHYKTVCRVGQVRALEKRWPPIDRPTGAAAHEEGQP